MMPDPAAQVMQCMEVWGGNALTDNSVSMAGLDAWVYSKPFESADAGGDVYYVSSCATGRITRLLVADVSGHGVKVQETARSLRDLMRRYVNHLDQRSFVRSMNRQFTELNADGCFATAVVTTFFGPTNYLTLCNAGHPTPLIYRAKTRKWHLLDRSEREFEGLSDVPLGVDNDSDYDELSVQLDVNDLVLCYSDSLMESHDADGTMLGEAGLLRVVQEISNDDPSRVIPQLLAKIATRHAGNLDADDVTALLFRANGTGGPTSLREKLMSPIRVWSGVVSALLAGKPPPLPDMNLANIGGAMFDGFNRLWRGKHK